MSTDRKHDYGFSLDNPIEVTDVPAEYVYLDSLYFMDGTHVCYRRVGSRHAVGKSCPVDKYEIYKNPHDVESERDPVAELYIYGYADMNTTEAPEGFVLRIERPDLWMMPPVWK